MSRAKKIIESLNESLANKIYSKFPRDSKKKTKGKKEVMLTGDTAKALDKESYTVVDLLTLPESDLDKLANLLKVK